MRILGLFDEKYGKRDQEFVWQKVLHPIQDSSTQPKWTINFVSYSASNDVQILYTVP